MSCGGLCSKVIGFGIVNAPFGNRKCRVFLFRGLDFFHERLGIFHERLTRENVKLTREDVRICYFSELSVYPSISLIISYIA